MAALTELQQWETEVFRIETDTIWIGGEDGAANNQAKQLANRTAYLKAAMAARQPLDATLTAIAALVTAADKLIYSTAADVFATTPLTAFARTLLDDANAAAVLATLGAAPLVSPTFSGAPAVPTAADGTNTTQAASTAFVQLAVGGYLAVAVTSGATAITLTDAQASNPVLSVTGVLTANVAIILPITTKRLWAIYNATTGAFTVTVKTAAGTGVTVAQGKRNLVYTDGVNVYDGFNDFESVALTGVPTAPTAAVGNNTTQIATTAFIAATDAAKRDASGGYTGLTLFKINFKNALNTFTSFFTNANTAARTYTFQDKSGTIADLSDVALKANSDSPTLVTPVLGVASATSLTLATDLAVADGGTGRSTGTTAYALVATGTTATGAQQSMDAGLTTEMLVGGGTTALPVWTAATGAGAPVRAASPTFTGAPAVPTAAAGTTTTQAASTAFVASALGTIETGIKSITATVASNALTLGLGISTIDFRAPSIGSGTVNSRTLSAALSLVVPSGATLGMNSAVKAKLLILALDYLGTIELAVINVSAGGNNLDESSLITTTAISSAADSAGVAYSTTARTGVPFRVVGYVSATEAVAGTWATAPSLIQGQGGQSVAALGTLGFDQTWKDVSASRAANTTYTNTTGKAIAVAVGLTSSVSAATVVLFVDGVQIPGSSYVWIGAPCSSVFAIVPPGGTYYATGTGGTMSVAAWAELS